MSITAFQRRRRELAKKEEAKEEAQEPVIEAYETFERDKLKKVNNDLLKARLNQLEIEYPSNAIKKELIDLLIGEEPEDNPPNGEENPDDGKQDNPDGEPNGEENQEK